MLNRLFSPFQNSFFVAIILLTVLVIALIIAVVAVVTLPATIGDAPIELRTDEMYHFSELKFDEFEYLDISYPHGGFIVPGYSRTGSLRAITIIGDGNYAFYPPDSGYRSSGVIERLYLPMQENNLAMLLLQTNYTEINHRNQVVSSSNEESIEIEESVPYFTGVRERALQIMNRDRETYLSVSLFGHQRIYYPTSDLTVALLDLRGHELVTYRENHSINLRYINNNNLIFETTHPSFVNDYPPDNLLLYVTATLGLLLSASVIVVWLLTIDIDERKQIQKLVEKLRYPWWLIGVTVFLYFASQFLLTPYGIDSHWKWLITISLYLLIFFVFCKDKYELQYMGITTRHLIHAVISALVLGFMFQLLGSFSMPTSIEFNAPRDLLFAFLIAFFFQALVSELVYRGLIQNSIERLTNSFIAVFATAGFVAFVSYVTNNYFHQMGHTEILIQSFLIAPFGSVVLGLLYARTRNIFASSLLAALLIILPRIIIF